MLPDVQRLASDIESSNPADPSQQESLHHRIVGLRSELQRAQASDLAAYLDSAADMVQYLIQMGRMGPEQVLGIAAGLVRKVESSFEAGEAPQPRVPTPPAPIVNHRPSGPPTANKPSAPLPDTAALKLEMAGIDERMLGEVMLQLGFVTRKQLEQGLVTQRATDLRIGEALVNIGAASWGQVKEAMAVQRRLRTAIPIQNPLR